MERRSQFGFTLFEITFAIVIMLLLVTIMVMGQDFTINSQVNRLEHDFRTIQMALYDSQDGLRLHGDVRKASLRAQDAASNNNGDSGMAQEGNWDSTSGETFKLWKNIRPAGLKEDSADLNLRARVPLKLPGGVIGVAETDKAVIAGLNGNYAICANGIAGRFVKKLDRVIDDGDTASGSMRVSRSIGGAAISSDSIVSDATYMVCMGV